MRYMTLFVGLALVATSACGGSSTGPSGGSGTLTMMLKDSPYTDAKAVLVTFSEVSAHRADQTDGTWSRLPFAASATARTCDLKKLQNAQDVLGTGSLTTGHYTQVRLVVSSAAVYFDNAAAAGSACAPTIAAPDGRNAPLDIPSGEVKLNREFDIASSTTTMLLDFDGDKSIRETGNGRYMMSPVISIVSVQ
jgi:hypothetical protein